MRRLHGSYVWSIVFFGPLDPPIIKLSPYIHKPLLNFHKLKFDTNPTITHRWIEIKKQYYLLKVEIQKVLSSKTIKRWGWARLGWSNELTVHTSRSR